MPDEGEKYPLEGSEPPQPTSPAERAWADMTEALMEKIYEPLTVVLESAGIHDSPILKPPVDFQGARKFLQRLWECCDYDEGRSLTIQFRQGAYQLLYLMNEYILPPAPEFVEIIKAMEPIAGKPFAVLASVALEELDKGEVGGLEMA